ncbi:MAG: hypothetical protein EZS28_010932 [Streblomastix strix]|uniref:Uncharacterized protein n=1 Tax=Streblomastix strix TaxID=222440 RepID=A0A5J4WFY3_9EUKA|nr:MAG: hypothetical protein EZS28_010932 [Streblomastix strix]
MGIQMLVLRRVGGQDNQEEEGVTGADGNEEGNEYAGLRVDTYNEGDIKQVFDVQGVLAVVAGRTDIYR